MTKLARIDSNPNFTIDHYDTLAWVSVFTNSPSQEIKEKLKNQGIQSAVMMYKSKAELPAKPQIWFGDVPETLVVEEHKVKYEIRTTSSHPGLFLDHQLTRKWLVDNANGKKVLNLFSYTGSLGLASAMGEAAETTNIDLSNPTTLWAQKNAQLNHFDPKKHQFIKGDVFDWLERFKKKNRTFDIVISDPPSQSRSDKIHFSTEKHIDLLHELCIERLSPHGTLIASINTEALSEKVLIASVNNVSRKLGRKINDFKILPVPEGFDPGFRCMKGLRAVF